MTTRQLARSLALVFVAVCIVAGVLAHGVGQHQAVAMRAPDGGHALTMPPPGAPAQTIGTSPNGYRYLARYPAADLPNFNLSTPIMAAAHHYGLAPVGLLALTLAECSGYTHGSICSHEWGGCDFSWGATQVNICTAAQYGLGRGYFDGDTGPNTSLVRRYEENATRAIWLAARILRHMRGLGGGRFPAIDILYNCGSYSSYIPGTICASNHAHFLTWWNVAAHFGRATKPKTTRVEPRTVGFDALDSPATQRRLWRIPATYVVESSTYGEAGLTGGFAPLRDTDAIVPAWTHQRVYLPGGHQDKYQFDGCIFIEGSGTAALFQTTTHQYFALLHMATCPLGGTSAPPLVRVHVPASAQQDDVTGLAFATLLHSGLARTSGVRQIRGGTFVGYSGWPSSYEYSNGSCSSEATCGVDAHLCLVATKGASDWFLWLAAGHDLPKPKQPFPAKRWSTYTRSHHARAVPYRRHGKTRSIARFWTHHQSLGGVKHEQTWHPKSRTETMPFQHGVITYHVKANHYTMRRTA